MKTNRAAAKRFRRTGRGKIVRNRSYGGHLMTAKTPRRRRRLRQRALVARADRKDVAVLLPYSGKTK